MSIAWASLTLSAELWDIAGIDSGIGNSVRLDSSDILTGIAVDIFNLQPVGFAFYLRRNTT